MSPSLSVCLLWLVVFNLPETKSHLPRMVFSFRESEVKRFLLPEQHTPVQILLPGEPDVVVSVGETHLNFYDFKTPEKAPVEKKVVWGDSTIKDYNISVVHQSKESGLVFACGTNGINTLCCYLDLSAHSLECNTNNKLNRLKQAISVFVIKGGEHSVLEETKQDTDLYITYSGAKDCVGLHKFGSGRVRPATNNGKEQHYVGLVRNIRRNETSQNRIYSFYKQKNKDARLDGPMWLPYVSQVCMSDVGGPKNKLQFIWTSQMNARLFCGNPETKQDFTELVDVATVHDEDRWEDTKIYALFRNEWGMSAVCVYTIGEIDRIFMTSPFNGSTADDEIDKSRKKCVPESTKISEDILKRIEKTWEMAQWVQPVNKFGPVLFDHQNYTHIHVDAQQHKANSRHTVMFLSRSDGRIHEAVVTENHSFVIAEYQSLIQNSPIVSIDLHNSSKKLYVRSRSELVQLNVMNCAQYGNTCEECVLSRNPYCGWDGSSCTTATPDVVQDVIRGNHSICPKEHYLHHKAIGKQKPENVVTLPSESKYFLRCPILSHYAQYAWDRPDGRTPCSPQDNQCLLLIDHMGPSQEGEYQCESEERGYRKVLAQYKLQLTSTAAGRTLGPAVWVCVVAVLMKNFCCYC